MGSASGGPGVRHAGRQRDRLSRAAAAIPTERDEVIAPERKITLKSPHMGPRFEFEMIVPRVGEKDVRIWGRSMSGVTAVNPASIQYPTSTA